MRPGVVLLSGLLFAPVSVVLFFSPLVVLFRADLGISVRCPRTRCFALRVSFRSPFRFAPRFSLCAPFVSFVPFALCTPHLIFYISFCTLFQSVSIPVCTPFGFARPFPSLHVSHTPHCSHAPSPCPTLSPQPPQTRGSPPSPHPKPHGTPRSGRSTEKGRSAGRTEDPAQLAGN